jgi:hypothetical protein
MAVDVGALLSEVAKSPLCVPNLEHDSSFFEFERYWDSAHPKLERANGYDPTERLNALASLADLRALILDVPDTYLIDLRESGRLQARDTEVALGRLALVVSRCTEVESGGRMIDPILTNTVLPRISEEHLIRMVQGRPLSATTLGVTSGDFSFGFA